MKAKSFNVPIANTKQLMTKKGNLQAHIKSVHEGQKIQCPHCEYKATWKRSLQIHIKSVHEGQKFQCPHCKHKATKKWSLQTHIKSVHEGQKLQCPHCEHKATKRHIKAVHAGQMSPSPSFKYQAKHKGKLPKNIKSTHERDKTQNLKTESLSNNDDVANEEYFETEVKSRINRIKY